MSVSVACDFVMIFLLYMFVLAFSARLFELLASRGDLLFLDILEPLIWDVLNFGVMLEARL